MKPKLRFQNFHDEWQEKRLGEIFINIVDKDHSNLPVLSVTQNKGVVYRDDLNIDIKYNHANLNTYKKVQKGEFIISLRSFQGGLELSDKEGIVSPAYTILNSQLNIYPDYWKYYFKTYDFIEHLKLTVVGIRDGKQINYSSFKDLRSKFPELQEQKKIARLLKAVDALIQTQAQQIQAWQALKQYFLQKLFVQGKHKRPEVRFQGFHDEWKQNILDLLCKKIKSGGTPTSSNSQYYGNGYPFLSISDMSANGKYIKKISKSITIKGLDNSSAWILNKNNLVLSMYASVGKIAVNTHDITFSQAIVGIIPKEDVSLEFVYQYMSYLAMIHYYRNLISEGTQKNLNLKKVKNIVVIIPSLKEQSKIADLLKTVDKLIELHQQKHKHFQALKTYFLQNLFC